MKETKIRLFRGLKNQFNPDHDISTTDAPFGYTTWTDNPELARQYAGKDGYVYYIDLPKKELGKDIINNEGERCLFFDNKKKCGLNNVAGKEFLIYTFHDLYDYKTIKKIENN